uniref:Uncharacterized protein n=1 Tax=Anguilla anguilla TaxID=7936 RepID=A0A0E9PSM4_ANGAN
MGIRWGVMGIRIIYDSVFLRNLKVCYSVKNSPWKTQ